MSSRRHQRRKQCEGKSKHKTFSAALRELHGSSFAVKRLMRIYRCRFCFNFHLGKMGKAMRHAMGISQRS